MRPFWNESSTGFVVRIRPAHTDTKSAIGFYTSLNSNSGATPNITCTSGMRMRLL